MLQPRLDHRTQQRTESEMISDMAPRLASQFNHSDQSEAR
jgi:hypothetical protein